MIYSQNGGYMGYGFAIPTTIMNKVVKDLKEFGTVQRALLGVSGQDVHDYIDMQKEKDKEVDLGTTEGFYVAEVEDDGAAADAGIEKGDVIISLDGKKITKRAEMIEVLANKRPGEKIEIGYLHNKKKQTKTVTLKNAQGNTKVMKSADLDVLGANFREITDAQKQQLEIKYGVEVIKVDAGAMKNSGISKGFIIQTVNDKPVRSLEDMEKIVKDASTSKEPVLYIKGIYPTGKKGYFAVDLQNN